MKRRFRVNPNLAEMQLQALRYTYDDVNTKSPMAFAEEVIRHARNAGRTNNLAQLVAVWNALDPYLQQHVPQPTENTNRGEFMQCLEYH